MPASFSAYQERVQSPQSPQIERIVPPAGSFDDLERLARLYGGSYDSYIATDIENKHYYWAADGDGVLCTLPQSGYAFVYGGILAPPDKRRSLVAGFIAECRRKRITPSFFNVGTADVELLADFGFRATKFGEEPIVDLNNCSWKGKDYEWVRRQTNFCLRNHLQFEEVRREAMSAAEWDTLMDEMDVISKHFLENKPHAERMKTIVSRFSRDLIFGQRVFIARNVQKQQVEAFVMCNPCLGGDLWAVESYRQRNDATRGVIPFLMHQCMSVFQQEGVSGVTLSMLPLIRCETPREGDSWVLRKLITLAHNHGNAVYDSAGLFHFKTRFRPHRFDERFICVHRHVTPGLLLAGMKSWGFHEISITKAMKLFVRQFGKRSARKQLATPQTQK